MSEYKNYYVQTYKKEEKIVKIYGSNEFHWNKVNLDVLQVV